MQPWRGFDELRELIRAEGETALTAAGIEPITEADDRERRGDILQAKEIPGRPRAGGSSWQSLERGTGSIEVDLLNGEIVLLGRLHGIDTPVNALIQRVANELARSRTPPGSLTEDELSAQLP